MSLYVRKYDLKSKQVKCYYKNADESMWAEAFSKKKIDKNLWSKNSSMDYFIKKFKIKKNAKSLEAGCGIAQNVYYLHTKGLDSYGVDFSEEIVKRVNTELAELKVSVDDVRKLKFKDDFFDVYFSFGVIEHFEDGFDDIIKEAIRVTKPGAILVINFPYMNPLRRLKAKFGFYDAKIKKNQEFYQFYLDSRRALKVLKENGARKLKIYRTGGIPGFKSEMPKASFLVRLFEKNRYTNLALNLFLGLFMSYSISLVCINEKKPKLKKEKKIKK